MLFVNDRHAEFGEDPVPLPVNVTKLEALLSKRVWGGGSPMMAMPTLLFRGHPSPELS